MPSRLAGPVPCGFLPANCTSTALVSRSFWRSMYFRRRCTRSSELTGGIVAAPSGQRLAVSWLRERLRKRQGRREVVRRVVEVGGDELGRSGRVADRQVAAARGLVAIHALVRVGEQRFVAAAVLREHRRARADGEGDPFAGARVELDLRDARLQLAPLRVRGLARTV